MEMLPENIVKDFPKPRCRPGWVNVAITKCVNSLRTVRAILKRLLGPIPRMLEIALVLEVVLGKTTEPVRAQTTTNHPFTSFGGHR